MEGQLPNFVKEDGTIVSDFKGLAAFCLAPVNAPFS